MKFNLPGAQALTTLAWGGITYQAGYKCAGEFENLLDAIKWGTDYFIKCHVSDNEYYAQVRYFEIFLEESMTIKTTVKCRNYKTCI